MKIFYTYLISCLWSAINLGARIIRRAGLIESVRLDTRVISVGNIQVGGAGKTPLVAKIAREAHARGRTVCILARGYGGRWERAGGIILPADIPARADTGALVNLPAPPNPADCGDEPVLLHDLCPFAYLGVGADRVAQYRAVVAAINRHQPGRRIDLVLLDDGFQHWRIQKDLEVVALTSLRPWQIIFRDGRRALREANLAVWTKGSRRPDSGGVPLVKAEYQLAPAPGTDFCLVTGIADGTFAYELALRAGYRIRQHLCFADHARYDLSEILEILRKADAANERVLVTGKDWVKWRAHGISPADVTVIEPELILREGASTWSQILWGD